MTQTHNPFLLYVGDTWTLDAALHDNSDVALNLAGAEIEWRLRNAVGAIVVNFSIGDGITVTSETGGLCQIIVPPATTLALPVGTYNDETRVTTADGNVSTQAVGSIIAIAPGSKTEAIAQYSLNPCETLAKLEAAKIDLLTGKLVASVSVENFTTTFSKVEMPQLDAAIAKYADLCAATQSSKPRRYAMRGGMFLRR